MEATKRFKTSNRLLIRAELGESIDYYGINYGLDSVQIGK